METYLFGTIALNIFCSVSSSTAILFLGCLHAVATSHIIYAKDFGGGKEPCMVKREKE